MQVLTRNRRLATIAMCFVIVVLDGFGVAEDQVELARDGRACCPVIIGENASESVRDAAADLSAYLGRISSAEFVIRRGNGREGIAVGTVQDFPVLDLNQKLKGKTIADREAYLLRSHAQGVYVIGATELAVQHAVWDLLHRLGYRQFFPGRTWEVVPNRKALEIAVDEVERPDYLNRRIWYGFGTWDYNREPYAEWCRRNRTASAFGLHVSHAYEGIIRKNKHVFDAHPEFLGLLDGRRESSKLCIGNPALRELVVQHALRYFKEDPNRDSISMDPSDGGGWCECDNCAALGSITDRALTLANQVAEAVNREFDDKYVGMYAYNYHSPPPSIRVHPNVIISIATSFIKGGYSLDELISGWSRQGATTGMREYYAVFPWDHDLPGRSRGSDLTYLQRTIPEFYAKGARFVSAESSDNWGCNGLGYYVASRLLWDVDEAESMDHMVEDFLTRAFGPAKEPMGRFYELIDGAHSPPLCDDLIGRLYRQLNAARQMADTPQVRERIGHLILYTRYVELYHQYSNSSGELRQAAFENLVRHGYRMRTTMMVHAKALYRDLAGRDKKVNIPEAAAWSVPEPKNPWKSSEPYVESEILTFLEKGIAGHDLRNFEPTRFTRDLVPATPLELPQVRVDSCSITGRGVQTFYTWVDEAPARIELRVTGGLIAHYRNRGNAKVDLWKIRESPSWEHIEVPVSHGESAPDGVERLLRLESQYTGLHKITVSDGQDMTRIAWDPATPMTVISSLDAPAAIAGSWSMYFYVPRKTELVGLYARGSGTLLDGVGNPVMIFDGKRAGFYGIKVPPGQDGTIWKFHKNTGVKRLVNIPPCLAVDPAGLLLPREVVEADSD